MATERNTREAGRDERAVEETSSPGRADGSAGETHSADRIAQRAYERYQMRGGEHGNDQEDWFEAEREINTERQR